MPVKMPSRFTPGYGQVAPPLGFIQFALEHPTFIMDTRAEVVEGVSNDPKERDVAHYIRGIAQFVFDHGPYGKDTRSSDHWDFPQEGQPRDCEDRCLLFKRFWRQPPAMLANSRFWRWREKDACRLVIATLHGEGHAMLSVETNRRTILIDWSARGPVVGNWTKMFTPAQGFVFLAREAPGYYWDDLRKSELFTLDDLWKTLP